MITSTLRQYPNRPRPSRRSKCAEMGATGTRATIKLPCPAILPVLAVLLGRRPPRRGIAGAGPLAGVVTEIP